MRTIGGRASLSENPTLVRRGRGRCRSCIARVRSWCSVDGKPFGNSRRDQAKRKKDQTVRLQGIGIATCCAGGYANMKTRQLKKKIGAVILGFSIISGVGLAMSSTVQAQYPNAQQDRRDQDRDRGRDNGRWRRRGNDDYPNWGGTFQLRQTALNAGFNEGLKEGRNDLRKHRRYDFHDSNTYRR